MPEKFPGGTLHTARNVLRALQGGHQGDADITGDVVARLYELSRFENVDGEPEQVQRGGFRFERRFEARRLEVAANIVATSKLGEGGDREHLATLAYAAASVALAFATVEKHPIEISSDRLLLGLVRGLHLNAGWGSIRETDHEVIVVASALVDMVLRCAELVDLLMIDEVAGRTRVTFDTATIQGRIDSRWHLPAAFEGLLSAYLYSGESHYGMRADLIGLVVPSPGRIAGAMALRWVIGHEWGHGAAKSVGDDWVGQREEIFADTHATILTAFSAVGLDAVPAEAGPAGGALFLACHDVLVRAISLARDGVERADDGDTEHPPVEQRIALVLEQMHRLLVFPSGMNFAEISFQSAADRSLPLTVSETEKMRVLAPARAIYALWDKVRPAIKRNHAAGMSLNARWA